MEPAGAPAAETVAPPGETRDKLSADALMADLDRPESPIHNANFMPVGAAGAARHVFSGTLSIPETKMQMTYALGPSERWFPEVDLQFVGHGDYLVPVQRGLIDGTGTKSGWSIILSPGRVWSEAADDGLSRASFPFVLAGQAFNESHNGLAMFLFDEERVSKVQFQIVQEAAPWNRFQAWGRLDAGFLPDTIDNPAQVTGAFDGELARRLPVRPWAELESRPGAEALALLDELDGPNHVSASGLVVDDVIYLRPCATSFGDYPYCQDMRHGVFSVTKTMGALLSLLRLAQIYGDEVFDLKVADYLEVTAAHDGWQAVRFGDALNMATGLGDRSLDPESKDRDEDNVALFWQFAKAPSARKKLRAAFFSGNYPWGPDQVFRYRSIDTFVLAAAMDAFLKSRAGPEANLWDMMADEVLRPIGIDHAPIQRTREDDPVAGLPILAWGLFVTVDEVAKIAKLLQNGGRHRDQQLLSAGKLKDALYRTDRQGKSTAWARYSYHMSFWHLALELDGCDVNVPQMMGYGGNIVQLLPNGMVGFYFQDGKTWPVMELARAGDAVRPYCPS